MDMFGWSAGRRAPCVREIVDRIELGEGGRKQDVARYRQAYKERIVGRLLPPESAALDVVSREVGVSVTTLERWRAQALADGAGSGGGQRWTAAGEGAGARAAPQGQGFGRDGRLAGSLKTSLGRVPACGGRNWR